jgi:hypothetical protein
VFFHGHDIAFFMDLQCTLFGVHSYFPLKYGYAQLGEDIHMIL